MLHQVRKNVGGLASHAHVAFFLYNNLSRVLKGHIRLARTVFPVKCKGHQLDPIARLALWESGLDYLHGTGHGVGAYLNVHEGPTTISYRIVPDDPGIRV